MVLNIRAAQQMHSGRVAGDIDPPYRLLSRARRLLAVICFVLGGISFVATLVDAERVLNRQSMRGGMDAQYWRSILTQVSGAACDLIIKNGPVRWSR